MDVVRFELSGKGVELDAVTVTVATTSDEVERLRPVWEQMQVADVDADIDFFLAVIAADPSALRPHVVGVARDGHPPLLVVSRIVRQRFAVKLGYRTLFWTTSTAAIIPFSGIMGCADESEASIVLKALCVSLEGSDVDVVVAQKLAEDSPERRAANGVGSRWRRVNRELVPLRFTDVPDSWETFLARRSTKSRRQLRYDENRVRKSLGSRMELRRLDGQDDGDQMIADMEAVARHSYQHAMGLSMVGSPVQHALIGLAARKGWLRVWMLYVDGAPVAFWWGLLYRGVLTIMTPGFLPSHATDRVGHYTFMQMLTDLCDDPETHTINYGPGDAGYKERFGTRVHRTGDVLLFRATRTGALTNAAVRADVRVHRMARRIANSTVLGGELTKLLRRRARDATASGPAR